MFALCALTIWGIVPWDLTAFLVCDLLLAAAILGGCTQRCRQLGRSRGDQSGSQPGQSKWPSTPINSRRKRQEGPAQRVGAYHSGGNASHPGPNNTAGQMGAAPSFHPEKGRATDGPQEKGGTGERNTQKKAQAIPGNREPRCTAPEHRASEQVPGKSQSCWKCSPAGPPGNTGGTKPKPSTENKPVDGSLGELGKQELQDPAKWAELLSRQCAKVAGSEQNPAERTAKEKEGDKSAPSA